MTGRSFTVFQDAPSSSEASTSGTKVARAASGILLTRSGSRLNVTTALDVKAATDKENYNPLTGERAAAAGAADKKRKTVLATKAHVPPAATTTKKQRADKVAQPEPKKRRTTATTKKSTTTKSSSSKKDAKSTSSTRKSKRSTPSRRVPPMPKVVEEETGSEPKDQTQDLKQAAIDSRCYELTVKPLADVSDAYEVPASTELVGEPKGAFRIIKEPSVEPELRDYFSPTHTSSSLGATQLGRFVEEESKTSVVFSTPERKKIYSAFTFSSPSPSAKRFRELLNRSGSPTPFATGTPPSPIGSTAADHDSS
ncbi:hypothetical protein CC1G_03608 [Coprinopsis cinerea okayama7|uniref:Uncharacterized protein n=1 Tax=Coprinopsis cinerea (strain Okayama-7 / 130 / ATCC MYA-4618 / FGSC 9003) TaxID=240176 RepID=A8NCQ0_COPC7|nr:hypothetical protein CC1G_03608 [Coprinopsis cinerea okayama7\|eukprot:XP_001832594.1 hypothetical protein CC1G_03608 [Coprinopsis cinerea okayama7\